MKLIVDSGSTKADWCLTRNGESVTKISTQGINPFHQSETDIIKIISCELMPKLSPVCDISDIDELEYYGAGCTTEKIPFMRQLLCRHFSSCNSILVGSDMLGACKALCGDKEGICCILGTGANSCYYDGRNIVANVSPMGFIIGDEGSGAVIGKVFVGELYKGEHQDLIPEFEAETGLNASIIIQKVYREPMPNRFLASLCLFICNHLEDQPWLKEMTTECFRNFFRKNVRHYNRPDVKVNFVGSIAFHFKEQLIKAADSEGYEVGRILKSPL